MENLVLRTRPAQWSTLLKRQPIPQYSTYPFSSSIIPVNRTRSTVQPSIVRRTITTSSPASQQAAARREQEDSSNDVSPRPSQADPSAATPLPPREPGQRTTMSARHLQEPRSPAAAPRRNSALASLMRARTTATGNSTTPGRTASSPKGAASGSSQSTQTNRPIQNDFLAQNPDATFFGPRRPQSSPSPSQAQTQAGDTPTPRSPASSKSTLDELLASIRGGNAATPGIGAARTPATRSGAGSSSLMGDLSRMQLNRPQRYLDQAAASRLGFSDMLGGILAPSSQAELSIPTFRISPSLGRTIPVNADKGMDVARAFRAVEIKCSINSVKSDLNKQRFHERGGIKRKRLAMSRWRRRFKEGFKATVRRVEDMRRKGW